MYYWAYLQLKIIQNKIKMILESKGQIHSYLNDKMFDFGNCDIIKTEV